MHLKCACAGVLVYAGAGLQLGAGTASSIMEAPAYETWTACACREPESVAQPMLSALLSGCADVAFALMPTGGAVRCGCCVS